MLFHVKIISRYICCKTLVATKLICVILNLYLKHEQIYEHGTYTSILLYRKIADTCVKLQIVTCFVFGSMKLGETSYLKGQLSVLLAIVF